MRPALILLLFAALAAGAALRAGASAQMATLTVTSAADPGDGVCDETCTLRDAILEANARPGPDRIEFAIGSGPATIRPRQPLPFLEDPGTVVDGTSQPGYAGRPLIMLDGRNAPLASGIVSVVAESEIRGLAVGNFVRYGLAAIGEEADGNRFLGNWVGVSLDGRTAAPNQLSGIAVLAGADNAEVGGSCDGCGNRLAGNGVPARTGHGLLIGGVGTVGARIVGNLVGLDAQGNALPNDDGILVVDGAHATIGGRSAAERNVVSGNTVAGIELRDTSFLILRVEGNYVGLDETGSRRIPNDVGIFVNGTATNVRVGAPVASAANVVSGNRVGIALEQQASAIVVQGNVIGLDATGRTALPNAEDGISVVAAAREIQIGGAAAGEGNWIAGNVNGIVIADGTTTDVRVEGNVLGLALDGQTPVPNETGIRVLEAAEVVIGGARGAGNIIVASENSGVLLENVRRAVVRGNRIGLRANDAPVGNGVGVTLRGGALENLVQENRIGGNVGAGIQVLGEATQRNRLTRNVFLTNVGIGIDLAGDGPSPNDADDADTGPNTMINAPVITDVTHDGMTATVGGTGAPRRRVEVYRISPPRPPFADPHPSGFGAGGEFLGVVRVGDDGVWSVALSMDPGTPVTALAVDGAGNTSEFARNFFPEPPVLLAAGFTPAGWFGPTTAARDAFAPLGDRLIAAFRFNGAAQRWDIYRPGLPFLSTLEELRLGDALWVRLSPGPRTVWSQPAAEAGARAVTLQRGLNFVTWTGPGIAVEGALRELGDRVETVFRWNGILRRFELVAPVLPLPGVERVLRPRDLLWVRVAQSVTWEQPGRAAEPGTTSIDAVAAGSLA